MQKLFTLCVSALMAITSICAQDIIVTNDAKKIEAKILEVTTSEIRYKEADNLNGPVFILRTDEINCIIYSNGKVVLYDPSKTAQNPRGQEELSHQQIEDSITSDNIRKAEDLINGLNFSEVDEPAAVPLGKQANPVMGECGSWQLEGRDLVGHLPQPANTFNQEGRVVVQITVDASGNVIEAMVIGGDITDKTTMDLALNAAKRAKFTSAKQKKQVGTITFIFKIK